MQVAKYAVVLAMLSGCGARSGDEACEADCKQAADCGIETPQPCESGCKAWLHKASEACEASYVTLIACGEDFTCAQLQRVQSGDFGSCASEMGQVVEDCPIP